MDCSLPGSSIHGIFQVKVLKWVVISFSRVSSWPRDQTWVFYAVGRHFTVGGQCEELRPRQRSWGRRLDIRKGVSKPQETPCSRASTPKTRVYLLYCFVLSPTPLTLRGALPHNCDLNLYKGWIKKCNFSCRSLVKLLWVASGAEKNCSCCCISKP